MWGFGGRGVVCAGEGGRERARAATPTDDAPAAAMRDGLTILPLLLLLPLLLPPASSPEPARGRCLVRRAVAEDEWGARGRADGANKRFQALAFFLYARSLDASRSWRAAGWAGRVRQERAVLQVPRL